MLADSIVETAALTTSEAGLRQRRRFRDMPAAKAPSLPASYLGKVKLSALRSYREIEAELQARGITEGWVEGEHPAGLAGMRNVLKVAGACEEGPSYYLKGGRKGDVASDMVEDELDDETHTIREALRSWGDTHESL